MIALMERSRCWFVPMRPVTPFMIIPTLCVVMVERKWGVSHETADDEHQSSATRPPLAPGPGDIHSGFFVHWDAAPAGNGGVGPTPAGGNVPSSSCRQW